jgi:hypothetical protein
MNSAEAKKVLLLYRGRIDESDPQFAEALAQAKRDPDLAEWLRQQNESYSAVKTKFREIEPPSDLREKIVRQRPVPFSRRIISPALLKIAAGIALFAAVAVAVSWPYLHRPQSRPLLAQIGTEITVTGEVLDMACYISDNLSGPEHADCARTCIRKGLPVGIKSQDDGSVYLLVGDSHSLNDQLADYAAKTITVKGTVRSRDGFAMLDNVTIQKL